MLFGQKGIKLKINKDISKTPKYLETNTLKKLMGQRKKIKDEFRIYFVLIENENTT